MCCNDDISRSLVYLISRADLRVQQVAYEHDDKGPEFDHAAEGGKTDFDKAVGEGKKKPVHQGDGEPVSC